MAKRHLFASITLLSLICIGFIGISFLGPSILHAETIQWRGEMTVPADFRLAAEDVLKVVPGAQIQLKGDIELEGMLIADGASFRGAGIILKDPPSGTSIRNTTFADAKTALKILGGSPVIEGGSFVGNKVGLELRQRSMATIKNSRFENNRKVGLFVKDDAAPTIIDNSFTKNGKFGVYLFRSNPTRLTGNSFSDNDTGLMAAGSSVIGTIEKNRFSGNQIALFVDRAAAPNIQNNRISDNVVGVKLHRRSDPTISHNLLTKNRTAIAISFSSYPQVTGNDFDDNGKAIFLEYQSIVWERAQGETTRNSEMDRVSAFGRSDKRDTAPGAERVLPKDGRIDASGNWWGSATDELLRGEKNISTIDDGFDRPTFLEDGTSYPLDKVDFSGWKRTRINGQYGDQE